LPGDAAESWGPTALLLQFLGQISNSFALPIVEVHDDVQLHIVIAHGVD